MAERVEWLEARAQDAAAAAAARHKEQQEQQAASMAVLSARPSPDPHRPSLSPQGTRGGTTNKPGGRFGGIQPTFL